MRHKGNTMRRGRNRLMPFFAVLLLTAALLRLPCTAVQNPAAQNPAAQTPGEPASAAYVSDLADVLPAALEAAITEKSAALDALTGAQLMVVTVDFLEGETIRDYTQALFSRLQIGDAAKNNGLLLLLAVGEEDYYALQGKGLETALPDKALGSLLQESLEPDFAAGQYEAGVQKTYDRLLVALENIYGLGDQGVLAALAEARAEQLHAEKLEAQKRMLLMAIGVVLLILLALFAVLRQAAVRRRKMRKSATGRQ